MKKSTWAKLFGWLGSLIAAGGAGNVFGKYSPLAQAGGLALMGLGVHQGSDTSAQHPNG